MASDPTSLGPNPVVNGYAAGGQTHILRIMKDLREFYSENPTSMHIIADEKDVTLVHTLIRGPERTPYHNGFFYFVFRFPSNYPLQPPHVKLVTTGGNTVRFNPNLYSNGKVCLSILGTWQGPAWSAAQTLFTTMLSIQTLMNEKPYHNEPGYEQGRFNRRNPGQMTTDANNYNQMIVHETLRVAVIGMLDENSTDSKNMPQELKDVMISFFKVNYRFYEDLIRSLLQQDGQPIVDPFRDPHRPKVFAYKLLLEKLLKLKSHYGICDNGNTCPPKPSASLATNYDHCQDPDVQSYREVADRMLLTISESKPLPKEDKGDNWDEILDQMNQEMSDDELTPYESDDSEEDNEQEMDAEEGQA